MADDIEKLGRLAWRDWVTDGWSGSGKHAPAKSEIRAVMAAIETRFRNGSAMTITSGTADDMNDAEFDGVNRVGVNKTLAGAHALTLRTPGANLVGFELLIFDIKGDAGTNNITINGAINNGTSMVIAADFGWVRLVASATAWNIIGWMG